MKKAEKQLVIRQLQKAGKNRMDVCVAPEIQKALGVENQGDNLAFEIEDDGVVRLTKAVPSEQNLDSAEAPSGDKGVSDIKGVDNEKQNPPAKIEPFTNCANCGSDEIEIHGDTFYCPQCDATFQVTATGVKFVPIQSVSELVKRIDRLEDDVRDLRQNVSIEKSLECPACGSTEVSEDWLWGGWHCNECEHSFDVPKVEVAVEVAAELKEDEVDPDEL